MFSSIDVMFNAITLLHADSNQVPCHKSMRPQFFFHCFWFCRRKGMIVNISSGIASIPFPLYTLYAASKVRFASQSQTLRESCLMITRFMLCSYRCLWRDFLKAYNQNTKIVGFLYRYFDPLSESSHKGNRLLGYLKSCFFKCHQNLHCLCSSGSGSIWGVNSNGRLPVNKHRDSVTGRLCRKLSAVCPSWRQNARQHLPHHSGKTYDSAAKKQQ